MLERLSDYCVFRSQYLLVHHQTCYITRRIVPWTIYGCNVISESSNLYQVVNGVQIIYVCTGNNFFTWMGPQPMVHITEPALIREILANNYLFQKARAGNPLVKLLARGLVDADSDLWAKHRKIINPAFHVEKLKVCVSY